MIVLHLHALSLRVGNRAMGLMGDELVNVSRVTRHAPEMLLFAIGVFLLTFGHQYSGGDPIIIYSSALVGLALVVAGMLLTFRRVRVAGVSMQVGESTVVCRLILRSRCERQLSATTIFYVAR